MLPWFSDNSFPLYLAPMAGVTDVIFRQICKELGADVMVTEFVSAEGIMQADERTRKYTEFTDEQRPVGVQLFGADGERMGEAAGICFLREAVERAGGRTGGGKKGVNLQHSAVLQVVWGFCL